MGSVPSQRFGRALSWRMLATDDRNRVGRAGRELMHTLRELAAHYVFRPGTGLLHQGATTTAVFLLEQGVVKVVRAQTDGREVIVGLRAADSVLGVSSALTMRPQVATVATITRCEVGRIEADTLRQRVQDDPSVAVALLALQCEQLDAQLQHAADLCTLPGSARLHRLLIEILQLLGPIAPESSCRIPLRQSEIADMLGVTPPYLSRLFRRLAHEGTVRWEDGCLTLTAATTRLS
jgi:CRP-like cAMP-binding protein